MNMPKINTHLTDEEIYSRSPLKKALADKSPVHEWLGLSLGSVWCDFEDKMSKVPVITKFTDRTITLDEYLNFLLNLRQQVKDGSRWIARGASNLDETHATLRHAAISHTSEEHLDYLMIERDYVASGGKQETIKSAEQNIGSEALSSYMFQITSTPNPVHAYAGNFIIEGAGSNMFGTWAEAARETLGLTIEQTSFLHYHGEHDPEHYDNLIAILKSDFVTAPVAKRMTKVAKVIARLYVLQFEELNNI